MAGLRVSDGPTRDDAVEPRPSDGGHQGSGLAPPGLLPPGQRRGGGAAPLPRGERDLALLIVDRSFADDGSLAYPSLDPTLLDMPGVESAFALGVLGDVI